MAKMMLLTSDAVAFLEELEKRIGEAKEWMSKYGKTIEIDVPRHLEPILGPKDGLKPGCAINPTPLDDQALVEVLALVQAAKEKPRPKS